MRISDWSSDVCSSDLGDLPQNLIATGTAELQDRTIQIIANEYGEALRDRNRVRIRTLRTEIEEAPATLDKARFLLSARREKIKTPEVLPILQIEPRSAEGRPAPEAILDRAAADAELPEDWSISIAWFLDPR